jgi:hypothetical protein
MSLRPRIWADSDGRHRAYGPIGMGESGPRRTHADPSQEAGSVVVEADMARSGTRTWQSSGANSLQVSRNCHHPCSLRIAARITLSLVQALRETAGVMCDQVPFVAVLATATHSVSGGAVQNQRCRWA